MHPILADKGTGLAKALHKLGLPDWALWAFLIAWALFLFIRRMTRE